MKTYTEEFKKTIVEFYEAGNKTKYGTSECNVRAWIKKLIEFENSKQRYGSPKITQILNQQGIKVSQERVARRMKALGIKSIIIKKFNHNRNKKVDDANKENLLAQNF